MDVLSEVLRVVRLEGALFFNAEFSAPWCISTTRSNALAPYLSPGAGHLILYHFLTEGRAYAKLADGPRGELSAGDIVIFRLIASRESDASLPTSVLYGLSRLGASGGTTKGCIAASGPSNLIITASSSSAGARLSRRTSLIIKPFSKERRKGFFAY